MNIRWLMPILAVPLVGAAEPLSLDIEVSGLRSEKGMIRICLFQTAEDFPDCTGNAQAIKVSIPAGEGATATVQGLSQGSYAVALLHDENANGKLDKSIGIPREGVGFSRNPSFFFGPPSFDAARFETDGTVTTEAIRVKYFL